MKTRALVLDRTHRVLLERVIPNDYALPSTAVGTGRPLIAIQQHLAGLGLERLPEPCGSHPREGTAVDFAFLVPEPPTVVAAWLPLRELDAKASEITDEVWSLYQKLVLGGWQPPTRTLDVFMFGDDPTMASQLAHLVVVGAKRATVGWCAAAEKSGETIPWPGLVSIVTDGHGMPVCAIETKRVDRMRFSEVGEEIAELEGEGDRTLEDWREGHRRYLAREAERLSLRFDEDALLFVERFRVMHVFGR